MNLNGMYGDVYLSILKLNGHPGEPSAKSDPSGSTSCRSALGTSYPLPNHEVISAGAPAAWTPGHSSNDQMDGSPDSPLVINHDQMAGYQLICQ